MRKVLTRKKFLLLTGQQVQAALRDKNSNAIKKEFYRLVDYFESILSEGDEICANILEKLMHNKKRPLIESMAIEYAAAINDEVQSTIEEAKIPPEALAQIGKTAFGYQWQTPLAKTLQVADRTMRRWTHDGAPLRIGRELLTILSAQEESIHRARSLLTKALERPKLHLVKS
jgi:hypothetical protein